MMRAAGGLAMAAALAVAAAACNGGSSDTGSTVQACNGLSDLGLESESTPPDAGSGRQCPSKPSVLTGTGAPGSQCQSPADCLAVCCPCAGGAHGALAAVCNNGNCLDANDVCCLYSEACD